MNLIPRMGRLFVAMTLLSGPSSSVFAETMSAPASPSALSGARVQPTGTKNADQAARALIMAGYGKLPVAFEANRGQTDASVKFLARVNAYQIFLTANEAVWTLPRPKTAKAQGFDTLRLSLKGANPAPAVSGRDLLPGHTSYFIGSDPSKWRTGVEQFAKVEYRDVYPGIDLVYYGNQRTLEHDFIVAPGADPRTILLHFEGAKRLSLNAQGDAILSFKAQDKIVFHAPILYQTAGSVKQPVKGRFVLAGKKDLRFQVEAYDRSRELVIDPQLVYSTYLGGSVDDNISAIAVDGSQQAYVTGWSNGSETVGAPAFPTSTGIQYYPSTPHTANIGTGADVFVAKLSADGTQLLWLAWLGGILEDRANGIALDNTSPSTPNVYITGTTQSTDFTNLIPAGGVALGASSTCAGNAGSLAFVAELSQTSLNLPNVVYSSCLGHISGTQTTTGNGIAVDRLNAAYVTGTTNSYPFPASVGVSGSYATTSASSDGFVFKINAGGTSMAWATLLGPAAAWFTEANAIAVDALGNAWVAGQTNAPDLPKVSGHFSSMGAAASGGSTDGFVAEVDGSGTIGLDYATYFNTNLDMAATSIALDNKGVTPYNVFVAGWTSDGSAGVWPSTLYDNLYASGGRPLPYERLNNNPGHPEPFVIKLNPFLVNTQGGADDPLEVVYATHLGPSSANTAAYSYALALALDDRDDAYIAGYTTESAWVIAVDPIACPAAACPAHAAFTAWGGGPQEGFIAAVGADGALQPFFSYLGSNSADGALGKQAASGIAIDALHNIYVAGYTPGAAFPIMLSDLQPTINGNGTSGAMDGFAAKIAPVSEFQGPLPPPATACTISTTTPPNPIAGPLLGGTTVTITGTGFTGISGPAGVLFNGMNASSYTVVSPTLITAVSPPHTPAGLVPLLVAASAGSCSSSFGYVAPSSSCTIVGLAPSSGLTSGGTSVDIVGLGFNGLTTPAQVTFGGVNAESYKVNSSSSGILAVSPPHPATGLVTLSVVTTSSGTCSISYNYVAGLSSCTIVGISPASGFTTGGTPVTIVGTGFTGLTGPHAVSFNGVAASTYTVTSATVIHALTPIHAATGSFPFTVTTAAGTCSSTFDFTASPVVGGGPNGVCGADFFYPSPATGATGTFAYCMAKAGTGRIRVYNVIGDVVAKIEDDTSTSACSAITAPAFACRSTLNTARLAPGVYLYRLEKDYGGGQTDNGSLKKFVVKH